MAFTAPLDIANRTCQLLGVRRIYTFKDSTDQAQELNFTYDKVRLAELERNLWVFATRRTILRAVSLDSVLWTPATWITGTDYAAGQVVAYTPPDGVYQGVTSWWQLSAGESPSTIRPDQDTLWEHYTGPQTVDLFDTGITGSSNTITTNQQYQSGELALVPAAYSSGTSYAINNVVAYGNSWYVSLVGSNVGNEPDLSPTAWALWTSIGRSANSYGVTATNSPIPLSYPAGWSVFLSLQNNNADNPALATVNWLNLSAAALTPLSIVWPIAAGPNYDPTTLNAFYLPYAFLKRAPTDPKGGQMGYLGANSGSMPEDYVLEGPFIVTRDTGPILIRFIADITSVAAMDAMFCEGLAARLGWAVAPLVKPDGVKVVQDAYMRLITDARAVNSIEVGPITPVENRYVTVRQ